MVCDSSVITGTVLSVSAVSALNNSLIIRSPLENITSHRVRRLEIIFQWFLPKSLNSQERICSHRS